MQDAYTEVFEFYKKRGFAGRVGYGKRPVLLVVDFIVAFTDPNSPLGSDLEGPLIETCRLLDGARAAGITIVFTTVEYSAGCKDAGLFLKKVAGLSLLERGSQWVQLDRRLER